MGFGRLRKARALAVTAVAAGALAWAGTGVAGAAPPSWTLNVAGHDGTNGTHYFTGIPHDLTAGTYAVNFHNVSTEDFHLLLVARLKDPNTSRQATREVLNKDAANCNALPDPNTCDHHVAFRIFSELTVGGLGAPPGGTDQGSMTVKPGRYYYFCPVTDASGMPHFDMGMDGNFRVSKA
jgi:hypothetical protein